MFINRSRSQSETLPFRRAAWLTLIVLLVLMVVVPPAQAATKGETSKYQYSEKVIQAFGAWINESENEFSDLTVKVYNLSTYITEGGRDHWKEPQVTLFYIHELFDPETNTVLRTEYEGFASLPEGTFEVSGDLSSASAQLTVPLYGYQCVDPGPAGIGVGECEEIEPITVQLDLLWAGDGELLADEYGGTFTEDGVKFHFTTSYEFRNTVLTGTVAGEGVVLGSGTATVSHLLNGTYKETLVVKS